jgi:hypothetical protein
MTLPSPDRTFPNTDTVGPPGPSGSDYCDKVAAEGQALWDRINNTLVSVGGTANAITASCDPPLTNSYQHGQHFFLVPVSNNTSSGTINVDSRGVVNVVRHDGSALHSGDLIAGEGVDLVAIATGSPAVVTELRLPHPTANELIDLASAGGTQIWEQIGDSGALGTVAQVEFTFTAGRYSQIMVILSDLTGQNTVSTNVALRNSTTAIITLSTSSITAGTLHTYLAEFTLGINAATKGCFGRMDGGDEQSGAVDSGGPFRQWGQNATAPDRVRIARAAGNLTAGRIMAYGLLAAG